MDEVQEATKQLYRAQQIIYEGWCFGWSEEEIQRRLKDETVKAET